MENKEYIEYVFFDELNIPTRVVNALARKKITTTKDLESQFEKDGEEVFNIRGIGKKSIQIIKYEYFNIFKYNLGEKPQRSLSDDKKKIKVFNYKEHLGNKSFIKPSFNNYPQEKIERKFIKLHNKIEDLGKIINDRNTYLKSILEESKLIDELPLPSRLINTLNKHNIYKVIDLCLTPIFELYNTKGVGKASLIKLSEVFNDEKLLKDLKIFKKTDLIELLLNRINNEKDKTIIRKRYGFTTGERMTLEEIGKEYNLTRERIRQRIFKSIKQLRHPLNPIRPYFINIIESIILKSEGVITDDEADKKIYDIIQNDIYDGSCILDLFVDLNWIDRFKIGDTLFYLPKYKFNTEATLNKIINLVKNQKNAIILDEILLNPKFKNVPDNLETTSGYISAKIFFHKLLRLNPKLEEIEQGRFIAAIRKGRSVEKWVKLIEDVLIKSNKPLHFSEITNFIKDLFILDKYPDIRRIHSILVEYPQFAHTGTKGMYGLTKWGFRKEPTIELVKECIKIAGYRIHWKQIYEYVSRFKRTSRSNVKRILEASGEFEPIGEGAYNIKEK